jgi:hypothetical protein
MWTLMMTNKDGADCAEALTMLLNVAGVPPEEGA